MYGLDLFSGIGGLTKALEGYVEPIAYCENDRYAQAVLLSRMATGDLPIAPIWDDVKTINKTHITPPEIIYGGFPCQDISVAGRGAGLAGERSGLFFEVARLVGELRPCFVFLENVSAITVRGAERVVGELCSIGYDCRWGILSAADVGANHRRERWWLLAHARHGSGRDLGTSEGWKDSPQKRGSDHNEISGPSEQSKILADAKCWRRRKSAIDPEAQGKSFCQTERKESALGSRSSNQDVADPESTMRKLSGSSRSRRNGSANGGVGRADTHSARLEGQWKKPVRTETQFHNSGNDGWWQSEPNVGRVANGVPFRVDRLKGLGNAVVPAQAREAFERLMGLKDA